MHSYTLLHYIKENKMSGPDKIVLKWELKIAGLATLDRPGAFTKFLLWNLFYRLLFFFVKTGVNI